MGHLKASDPAYVFDVGDSWKAVYMYVNVASLLPESKSETSNKWDPSVWVKKEEYDESGPGIVHRKCF